LSGNHSEIFFSAMSDWSGEIYIYAHAPKDFNQKKN